MSESKYESVEGNGGCVCPDVICGKGTCCGITVDKAVESALRESSIPLSMEELKRVVFAGAPQKAQSEWNIEKTVELLICDGHVGKCGSGYALVRGKGD